LKPSKEEIYAQRTVNGGWTRDSLAAWGVGWPPPKGWLKALLAEDDEGPINPPTAVLEDGRECTHGKCGTVCRYLIREE